MGFAPEERAIEADRECPASGAGRDIALEFIGLIEAFGEGASGAGGGILGDDLPIQIDAAALGVKYRDHAMPSANREHGCAFKEPVQGDEAQGVARVGVEDITERCAGLALVEQASAFRSLSPRRHMHLEGSSMDEIEFGVGRHAKSAHAVEPNALASVHRVGLRRAEGVRHKTREGIRDSAAGKC